MSGSHGDDDIRRKKLLFRSWHRGTRELDLIFGAFADAAIEALDADQLDDYERLLNLPDSDLMDWLLGVSAVPAEIDSALLRRVFAFRQDMPL